MIVHQPGNSRGNFNYNALTYTAREYAPHFHKNMELICVLRGSARVTVNGRSFAVGPEHWVLVLSNQIHSFQVPADALAWVCVFSEEYVPAFLPKVKDRQGVTSLFTPTPEVVSLVSCNLIHAKCSRLMRKACLYAVCDCFLSQVSLEAKQEKTSFLVGQLLDWVAGNYTQDISLKQAAALFGYEYHYLSRLLNKSYAISFTQLLAGYRIERAVQLLQDPALSITQIAELSGFQSIRSFHITFKKFTGVTPNAYRSPIDKIHNVL